MSKLTIEIEDYKSDTIDWHKEMWHVMSEIERLISYGATAGTMRSWVPDFEHSKLYNFNWKVDNV